MTENLRDFFSKILYDDRNDEDDGLLVKMLDSKADEELFCLISDIEQEKELLNYLLCLLVGSAQDNPRANARLNKLFLTAIILLKKGKFSSIG